MLQNGYGVVVMNTNDNSRRSKGGHYTTIKVSGRHWCVPYALSFHCCLHLPPLDYHVSPPSLPPPLPILPLLPSLLLLPLPSIHCLQGSGSPDEHAQYVWDHYVDRSAAKRIDIVAHSYGGCVTVTLVREPCVTVTLVREACVTVTSGRRTVCHCDIG